MITSPSLRIVEKGYGSLVSGVRRLQHPFLLALRLYWGWQFFLAGKGKLADITPVAGFFGDMGIPMPLLSAYLAGATEAVGGLLLLAGFASRLAAVPLIFVMCVAYLTAHRGTLLGIFADPDKFVKEAPFLYLLTSMTVLIFGPGLFSVDGWIKGFVLKKK